jgi:hypothetical protein
MKKSIKKGEILQGTFGRIQIMKDFLPSPKTLKKMKAQLYCIDKIHSGYVLKDGEQKK